MTTSKYLCDFCGKDNDQAAKMVVGPTMAARQKGQPVAICDECIDLAHEIVHDALPADIEYRSWFVKSPEHHRA